MTGWRLGYGLFPKELAPAVARLMTNSNSCTAAFTQLAGVAALTGSQRPSEQMVAEFHKRRDVIVAGLNDIPGLSCQMPKGAFYAFPNITATGMTSREVADLLLYEGGVAALAGTAFGVYGEGYIRLSYANSIANIEKALDRIKSTLAGRVRAGKSAKSSKRATTAKAAKPVTTTNAVKPAKAAGRVAASNGATRKRSTPAASPTGA